MTVEQKAMRLSKVAREFNIGISTIVEYLKKQGHEVESNPNTKITSSLYDLLLNEFKSEKTVKEEAAKIGFSLTTDKLKEAEGDFNEKKEQVLSLQDTVIPYGYVI